MNRLEGKVAVITGCSHGMGPVSYTHLDAADE